MCSLKDLTNNPLIVALIVAVVLLLVLCSICVPAVKDNKLWLKYGKKSEPKAKYSVTKIAWGTDKPTEQLDVTAILLPKVNAETGMFDGTGIPAVANKLFIPDPAPGKSRNLYFTYSFEGKEEPTWVVSNTKMRAVLKLGQALA